MTLDLTGCVGCMSLSKKTVHMYLMNIGLTGLERLAALNSGGSSSSSGDDGAALLSLPLWAFQFNRSSGNTTNVQVFLRNVTLTLPQADFLLLLTSLPATGGQQQPAGGQQPLPAGVDLKVGGMSVCVCVWGGGG